MSLTMTWVAPRNSWSACARHVRNFLWNLFEFGVLVDLDVGRTWDDLLQGRERPKKI